MRLVSILSAVLCSTAAYGDVQVTFSEGAPKDRFTFRTTDACLNGPVRLTVDLSGSEAGLLFDVTGEGAGVEVFQPFELVAGGDLVSGSSTVKDGDTALTLSLDAFPKDSEVAFTIDLDDTLGGREITVNGAEITGATVTLSGDFATATGVFDANATALIAIPDCVS